MLQYISYHFSRIKTVDKFFLSKLSKC